MKRIAAIGAALLVILGGLVVGGLMLTHSKPPVKPTQVAVQKPPTVQELWQDTNKERQKANLPTLVLDPALDVTASAKCTDMSTKHYWSHDAPDGRTWQSFLQPVKYLAAGENLASDEPDAQATIDAWMGSPEHRENLLNPIYINVGFAVCNDSKLGTIVVQHFTDMQP